MKRLFGTDGIRAVAGSPPLDPETVRRFGKALGEVLRPAGGGAFHGSSSELFSQSC